MSERTSQELYGSGFFEGQHEGATRSAEAVIPFIMELLNPVSVVDVGCGVGAWLAAFRRHGVRRILGIDGEWVDRGLLKIPEESFASYDVRRPLKLSERFDLVVSLEVAEHLPRESADTFVESLTGLGPAVLFSAAIPFQGGTGHINEQWPEYWVRRFEAAGYGAVDCVRRTIWNDERIEYWYRQNILLFASSELMAARPRLQEEALRSGPVLPLVHPTLLMNTQLISGRAAMRALPAALKRGLLRRFKRSPGRDR